VEISERSGASVQIHRLDAGQTAESLGITVSSSNEQSFNHALMVVKESVISSIPNPILRTRVLYHYLVESTDCEEGDIIQVPVPKSEKARWCTVISLEEANQGRFQALIPFLVGKDGCVIKGINKGCSCHVEIRSTRHVRVPYIYIEGDSFESVGTVKYRFHRRIQKFSPNGYRYT